MSRISNQDRLSSRTSRSVKSNKGVFSKHEKFSPSARPAKLDTKFKDYGLPESLTHGLIDAIIPPGSNLSTSKLEEKEHCGDEKKYTYIWTR